MGALGRGLTAAVCAAFVLSGCDSGSVDSTHRPTPFAFDAHRIVLELAQGWQITGPGRGAYGGIFNLEAERSLFETSWHLRVASALGIAVSSVSRDEVATWAGRVLAGADTGQYTRLEALYLAVGALRGLGVAVPSDALSGLDRLRSGGLYSWNPGDRPSWTATTLATLTLADLSDAPPAELSTATRQALDASLVAHDLTSWLDVLLPVWTVADLVLPPAVRAPLQARLATSLGALRGWSMAQPVNEETVFIDAQVSAIARANALSGLVVPIASLRDIVTPLGYLVAAQGDPKPSMTNTYYALTMGYAPPGSEDRQLLDGYLQWSAAPAGWRDDVSSPEPAASFYSWEVSRALGETSAEQPLKAQVAAWLGEDALATTWRSLGRQDQVYFLILLARSLEVPLPAGFVRLVQGELAGHDEQLSSRDLPDLARQAMALGLAPGPYVRQRWQSIVDGPTSTEIRRAEAAITVSRALGDERLAATATSQLTSFETEVLWRAGPGAPEPDLLSTAIGAGLLGRSPALAAAVNSTFANQRGYWLLPSSAPGGGNAVEPMTLYLGLWLTGAQVDGGGVP